MARRGRKVTVGEVYENLVEALKNKPVSSDKHHTLRIWKLKLKGIMYYVWSAHANAATSRIKTHVGVKEDAKLVSLDEVYEAMKGEKHGDQNQEEAQGG